MTTFSAMLTNFTVFLFQSRDYSCYVSWRMPSPPPLWLHKHTNLWAHNFAHSPELWHQPKVAKVTCAWIWRLCGIFPAICNVHCIDHNSRSVDGLSSLLRHRRHWFRCLCPNSYKHIIFFERGLVQISLGSLRYPQFCQTTAHSTRCYRTQRIWIIPTLYILCQWQNSHVTRIVV
jgi:hypothetical protein